MCEIISNLGQSFWRWCYFKIVLLLALTATLFRRRMFCAILTEDTMGNSCVKSFRIFTSGSEADVN